MRATHYIAAAAFAALALPCAHAQTYRWVDERGVVTFSEALPDPGAVVYELDVVQGTASLSAAERRTLELINADRRQYRPEPAPTADAQGAVFSGAQPQGAPDAQPGARRGLASAASDPCLLSPDPRCYEKNAHNYDPYHGYVAGVQPAVAPVAVGVPAAVGASAPAVAGGRIAGNSPAVQPVSTAIRVGPR